MDDVVFVEEVTRRTVFWPKPNLDSQLITLPSIAVPEDLDPKRPYVASVTLRHQDGDETVLAGKVVIFGETRDIVGNLVPRMFAVFVPLDIDSKTVVQIKLHDLVPQLTSNH